MALSRRPRSSDGYPRTAAQVFAAALAAGVLFLTQWAGPVASASTRPHRHPHAHASSSIRKSSSHKGWVKYYIVQPPRHGHKEFLFEIAAKTLGNGRRAKEIFELNKGRTEPHGAQLRSPTVIQPGWILVLPKDASGRGVHFGKLPAVKPVPHLSPSPAASTTATPSVSPSTAASSAAAAASSASPMTTSMSGMSPSRPHGISMRVVMDGGAALILLLLLLVAWLTFLIRRRRKADVTRTPRGGGGPRGPRSPMRPRRAARSPSNALAIGTAPELDASGSTWPYPNPVPGGGPAALESPPLLRVPDSLGAPTIEAEAFRYDEPAASGHPAWMADPAELGSTGSIDIPSAPGHPAATGSDDGVPRMSADSDALGRSAGARGPAPIDDTGEFTWPDYLSPGISQPGPQHLGRETSGSGPATAGPAQAFGTATAPEPATPVPATPEPGAAELSTTWPTASDTEYADPVSAGLPAEELATAALSPVALRILGAQRSSAQLAEAADMPVQRHELVLGDDRIQVVLAQAPAPAASHDGKPRNGGTWLTSTPYLVWSPLPYDTPDGGVAFACLGAGDEGCLFIDLAAAPGAVAIGGEGGAPARLAEAIAHQLCAGAAAGSGCIVIAIGDALPEPHPSGTAWVASLRDLGSALLPAGPDDGTEVVFCKLYSNEDAFSLARYVSSAQHRVVPVVLADLPDAPWSFNAQPSRHPDEVPQPMVA